MSSGWIKEAFAGGTGTARGLSQFDARNARPSLDTIRRN